MDSKIQIGIIDTGVVQKGCKKRNLLYDVEVTPKMEVITRNSNNLSAFSHGNMCAAILQKYAPAAVLSSIKILNHMSTGNTMQLVKAIEWCLENNIRLVNVSLGTIDFRDFDPLRKIVNQAAQQGIVIVAANSNKNVITYPAALSNAIGVMADQTMTLKGLEYIYHDCPFNGIELTANSDHFSENVTGGCANKLPPSNSFAAPAITALVHNIMVQCPGVTLCEIKQELRKRAPNTESNHWRVCLYNKVDWAEQALLFSLGNRNKVSYALARPFFRVREIVELGDDNALRDIKLFLGKHRLLLQEIDTIVIDVGLQSYLKDEMKLLTYIAGLKKNLIYLSEQGLHSESEFEFIKSKMKLWHARTFKHFFKQEAVKFETDKPVIMMFDFTGCELIDKLNILADAFKADGFNTVIAANISSAVMYGFEFIPLLPEDKQILGIMKTIYEAHKPDIIIFGICAFQTNYRLLNFLETSLAVDIKIIISNDPNDLTSYWHNCGKAIILYVEHVTIEKRKNTPVFDYTDRKSLIEMYNYIVQLLSTDVV